MNGAKHTNILSPTQRRMIEEKLREMGVPVRGGEHPDQLSVKVAKATGFPLPHDDDIDGKVMLCLRFLQKPKKPPKTIDFRPLNVKPGAMVHMFGRPIPYADERMASFRALPSYQWSSITSA